MAQRRMFTKQIIDSDSFLDMPLSTQSLYFHLSMRADDEGFIDNHKKIMRMIGASEDELKVLLSKNFLIVFESGVIVIKHWKMHNAIRKDRIKETVYLEEKSMLNTKENGSYTLCQPNVNQMSTKCPHRLGEVSIGKDRLGEVSIVEDNSPAMQDNIPYKEIIDYLNALSNQNYRYSTTKTKELIKARFKEGFTKDDFFNVIAKKTGEWIGTEYQQYLRPITLFGTKFESYLNQGVKKKTLKDVDIDYDDVDIRL